MDIAVFSSRIIRPEEIALLWRLLVLELFTELCVGYFYVGYFYQGHVLYAQVVCTHKYTL